MEKQEVIARIVKLFDEQSKWSHYNATFLGQPQTLRAQGNEAITRWIEQNDSVALIGFVRLLAAMDVLSLEEADKLVDAIHSNE